MSIVVSEVFKTKSILKVTAVFILYYIFHGIAMGGINSALVNMIFDYVPYEKRADSLAVSQAISGLTGFLTTLCVSPFVSYIQSNSNTFFGVRVYAQQAVTIISIIFIAVAIVYVRAVLIKKAK